MVAATAAGLAGWLREQTSDSSVVVGHDARHQSDEFAHDVSEILAGAGVAVSLLSGPVPTPVLSFAVGELRTSAGVMVTASHNPSTDNGLKVYLSDTSQIAPPTDAEIADHITRTIAADELQRSAYRSLAGDLVDRYVDAVVGLVGTSTRTIKVAYTPLHGVGADIFQQAATRAGFTDLHTVAAQASPDPNFPTVAFPNPEEPGAMDQVLDLGDEIGADVAVAHDPDADRCAVAIRVDDALRVLTGDEVGVLLADHLLRNGRVGTFASSLVSSDLLGRVVASHGQPWQQTLTGFKWIGKVPKLAFGYEEALGYCVAPNITRDKDGISAALVLLHLADDVKAVGRTLLDRRNELFGQHGFHLTEQVSARFTQAKDIAPLMQRLRVQPPQRLGGSIINEINDLRDGYRGLPPTDGLRLAFDRGRVIIRPSGTEPKVKCYVEVVDSDEVLAQASLDLVCADLRHYLATATSTGVNR